ncbi:MAG TPA: Maf family protein [candidate division Zixibacteria bacterium]|nr:Maf family protein [candidate division Zixibacteria bacterium]
MSLPELPEISLNNLKQLSQRARIVLGSASPRRREFMRRSGVPYQTASAEIDEIVGPGEAPDAAAMRLALEKCRAVAEALAAAEPTVIIGSDTIVWHEGESLGKPVDDADAARLLRRLSGRTHTVYTGVCLLAAGFGAAAQPLTGCAQTEVTFIELTEQHINDYIATGDPLDKAGAYGAQQLGAFLVDRINGDLDTVIGFPRALVDSLAAELLRALPAQR